MSSEFEDFVTILIFFFKLEFELCYGNIKTYTAPECVLLVFLF